MSDSTSRNCEYSEGKLWFERQGTFLTLGLTSSAIDDLGSVESVNLPDEGEDFTKGEVVATIEGSKGSLEMITPASGVVEAVNSVLQEEPDRVAEDPLEEGWLIKVKIEDSSELPDFN